MSAKESRQTSLLSRAAASCLIWGREELPPVNAGGGCSALVCTRENWDAAGLLSGWLGAAKLKGRRRSLFGLVAVRVLTRQPTMARIYTLEAWRMETVLQPAFFPRQGCRC